VDTLFELGGQDAKFVALQAGVPVDYSMNDGCSAGTGSFLEEAAASDMEVPIEGIGPLALQGSKPVSFGERCAAFINTEVRAALQQGAPREDVLAGLVYAITDNYLSRVVGARSIGRTILLQGGVALNPALACAVAARTGMRVVVPAYPELMGAIGAAWMARDLLNSGGAEAAERDLESFARIPMQVRGTFTCGSCGNRCEIQRIGLNGREHPFGGLCAKWEMQRRPASLRRAEGRDLVELRQALMFRSFAPASPANPRGRIGLPLALSTYELYPLYSRLLVELGFEVVLSRPGRGRRQTYAPVCYPGELLHAAVDDLLEQGVDYLFLPSLRELPIPSGHEHAYLCPVVQDIAGVIRSCFPACASRILSPELGFSEELRETTTRQIVRLAATLGATEQQARSALRAAVGQQKAFEKAYREAVQEAVGDLQGPVVILAGRPYAAFAPEVNLSIPRKFASRGVTVVPGDALPLEPPANRRNVWHYTQGLAAAAEFARCRPGWHVCVLSCFSCGPDAIIHHRLRRELANGKPFCFLEIDSHTAHAGIETRIGAFLDIIEERRGQPACPPPRAAPRAARLQRCGRAMGILDSAGRRIALDDERVVHVLLADLPRVSSRMVVNLYGRFGWRTVVAPDMSQEILQKARRVCSGRECLPFLAMMGKVVAHLESRRRGEITVFHLLEQEGPCQIGNWYDALPLILERLGCGDAVAAWPTIKNNYLGGGEMAALAMAAAMVAGDLMEEARVSLACLAEEPETAAALLAELEEDLLGAASRGLAAAEGALRRISRRLRCVPLRACAQQLPRVLLFGGINRIFVDKPIRDFFLRQRILAKTNDISEFLSLLEYEWVARSGFAHGHLLPEQHLSVPVMIGDLVRGPGRPLVLRALRARFHCGVIGWLERRWRRIMAGSGLLFSSAVPFRELARQAQDKVSWNGFTEAPCTLGRYFSCLQDRAFDGYVNVGAFNCAPANTATAVISALRREGALPYAAVEADGARITPDQVRQLETVAAQCLRRRQAG
jgi:predicted nucleotide-binding protein (sugar kinase/HSP70/actin superfamily)